MCSTNITVVVNQGEYEGCIIYYSSERAQCIKNLGPSAWREESTRRNIRRREVNGRITLERVLGKYGWEMWAYASGSVKGPVKGTYESKFQNQWR